MDMPHETYLCNANLPMTWHQETDEIQLGSAPNQPFLAMGAEMVSKTGQTVKTLKDLRGAVAAAGQGDFEAE